MADLDKNRNTDVPGSIAGYYYQILLACKEISRYDEVEEVGVETGADVNVITKTKDVVNIEAKFHKQNFGKYSNDIVKTIYNFYTTYDKSIKQFIFSTNATPTKECEVFFANWSKNGNEEQYIKQCILRKSIQGPCKDKYKEFCENIVTKEQISCNTKEIDLLIEEIFYGTGNFIYEDYAVVNPKISYQEFINRLKFRFEGKKKQQMIWEIRSEIKNNIETTMKKLGNNVLEEDEYDMVINKMIDYFLEIILINSEDNRFKKRFTCDDFIRILNNYNAIEEKHISKYQIFSCIQAMQVESEDVIKRIRASGIVGKDRMEENYQHVQHMLLDKLAEPNGYQLLVHAYQLRTNENDGMSAVLSKIIDSLCIIMTKENLSLAEIKLILENSINNIKLKDFLLYTYKYSYSRAYRHMDRIVAELIHKYQEETVIDKKQIFVVDADYKNNGRPCEVVNLKPEIYDYTQTDENGKDYKLFCNLNYKCTKCLDIDDEDGYWRFKSGGGSLCKKI